MPDLILLRHGKAEPNSATGRDFDRPLAAKGIRAAKMLGPFFQKKNLEPQVALCSSAQRTRETLQYAAESEWQPEETHFLEELYLAKPETIVQAIGEDIELNQRECQTILVVGHNPGLSQAVFLFDLEGAREMWEGMKVGSLAHFHLEAPSWPDLLSDPESFKRNLSLRNYWTPKMIFEHFPDS